MAEKTLREELNLPPNFSLDRLGLNDIGLPVLTHWMPASCGAIAPGDCVDDDDVGSATCPRCKQWAKKIIERQR